MDRGDEQVQDANDVRQLRAQSLRIHAESIIAAGLLTGLALLLSVGVAS